MLAIGERALAWRRRLLRFGVRENAHLREGNTVALYPEGCHFLEAWMELIGRAERTVDLEIYAIDDDSVGRSLVDALAAAARRGVVVRMIYDAVGSLDGPPPLEELEGLGALVVAYHPIAPWRMRGNPNHRNHRKLVVVDDTVAVLGSANFTEEYDLRCRPDAFRDVGLGILGPVVKDIADDFRASWRLVRAEALPPPQPPRSGLSPPGKLLEGVSAQLVSGLRLGDFSALRRLYSLFLKNARHSILIANPYFVPSRRLLRALRGAARRGLRVEILTAGETDQRWVQLASRATYGRLLRAGAHVYERNDRMLHTKAAVLDDEVGVVGTANLDSRSVFHNLEVNVNVHDARLAATLSAILAEDREASVAIDRDEWARRPLRTRLLERFAYLFRYWM